MIFFKFLLFFPFSLFQTLARILHLNHLDLCLHAPPLLHDPS